MLTILSVAYPPAAVSRDACGGAEQILSLLDAAIAAAGHKSLVLAAEGSSVTGRLIPVPPVTGPLDAEALSQARERHRAALEQALQENEIDLVHMHGFDFDSYLPAGDTPVLATLHCPPKWYSPEALAPTRPNTWLNAVSARQHAALGDNDRLMPPIENGVNVDAYASTHTRRGFALMLARIAPEKGIHVALDAARRAGVPLVVAGELDPYPEHRVYYETQVLPRLDQSRRWVGPVTFAVKRRLLAEARCLIVCSEVDETSSLAAREALASGTPVVATARGALLDTIDDGRTGFLVADPTDLAAAIGRAPSIDSEICRRAAKARFDARQMSRAYLRLYEKLVSGARAKTEVPA